MSGSPERFAIGFDRRDRDRLHALWDAVIAAERWSEGPMTGAFEAAWAAWNGLDAVAFASWTGATLAALEYVGVRGQTVLCPSNTLMATPLVALHAGAEVAFVDCNRDGRAVQGGRDAERDDQDLRVALGTHAPDYRRIA